MSTSMSMPELHASNPMISPSKNSFDCATFSFEKANPIEISKSLGFTDHVEVLPNNEAA